MYHMELTTAMLADGAHVAGGKLYILGGQWDRLMVAAFPAPHPSMTVVTVIKVEYTEAPRTFEINVELTLDGQPKGAKASGQLATGHAPGLIHGAPSFVSLAIPFNNVTFAGPGRYEWVITADEAELGRIPLEVVQVAMPGLPSTAAPDSRAGD
jgi:hypothetical protein